MDTAEARQRWAARLQALLAHKGWRGRELARRADLSPSLVAAVVRGEPGNLSAKSRRYLAQALGWPDWEAMMGTERLDPPPQRESAELAAVRRLLQEALRLMDEMHDNVNGGATAALAPGLLAGAFALA